MVVSAQTYGPGNGGAECGETGWFEFPAALEPNVEKKRITTYQTDNDYITCL